MVRRTRVGVLALVGTVSVPVMIAGMAWACGPSGYGTPESPAVPNTNTAPPPTAPAQQPTVTLPNSEGTPAVSVQVQRTTATTKSVDSRGPSGTVTRPNNTASPRPTVLTPSARADLNARLRGGTAGLAQERGQAVFRSSTAPKAAAPARAKSKGKARPAAKSTPTVSERAATGDLWGGLASADANLASAAALGNDDGGLSGGMIAALAVLGLGLAGLTGGALATAGRRRMAGAAKRQ